MFRMITDAAVIVGPSRTYGKGLVQKIVPLPYNSALKYTIARYYTPSGRCIQSINYNGGRGDDLTASISSIPSTNPDMGSAVLDADRKTFLTQHGRTVLDGGGSSDDGGRGSGDGGGGVHCGLDDELPV